MRLLQFDLGGVLVEFSGVDEMRKLLPPGTGEEDVQQGFETSAALRDFQLGNLSAGNFATAFILEWSLPLEASDFLRQFESWTKRLYPGVQELLEALRPHYRLAALSNSNELHWRRNNVDLGIEALFERAFSSHEIGLLKPDPAAFRFALDALKIAPADVTFSPTTPTTSRLPGSWESRRTKSRARTVYEQP